MVQNRTTYNSLPRYEISITVAKKKVWCKYKQKSFRVRSVMSRGHCGFRSILPYRQNIFLRVKKKVTDIKQISSGSTLSQFGDFYRRNSKTKREWFSSSLGKTRKSWPNRFQVSVHVHPYNRKQIQCITIVLNSITGLLFLEFSDARDDLAFYKDSK